MSGRNSDAGCGTIIFFLMIIGFISSYWPVILGTIAVIALIYFIYVILKNKNSNEFRNSDKRYIKEKRNALNGGFILESGKYVATRDIESGIYDLLVLDGYGFINTDVPENVHVYLNQDNKKYNNIEISNSTVLKIDTGLKIEFYNKRTYVEENRIGIEYKPDGISKDVENSTEKGKTNFDIDKMDGWKFEHFCAEVLKENRYNNVNVTPGSGDQVVDITAERDGIKYAIQCKRFSQPVGNKAVQEIYAGKKFYRCHVGIIMTNNYFTASAKELAGENGIILWDRDFLMKFLDIDNMVEDSNIQSESFFESNLKESNYTCENNEIIEDSHEKEREERMYDSERGIYPPGMYVAGEDLPLGKYLLKRIGSQGDTMITFYENYSKYRKQEINQLERFSDDYYISLRESGMVIAVRNAEIRKL